jgi:hypothetical protein
MGRGPAAGLPLALALVLALVLALAAGGCGGKFSLPEETPGGVIPEKGSYQYLGSVRGLTNLTDVLLTLGVGTTLYVAHDHQVHAFPRLFRSDGSTPPLSFEFQGTLRPEHLAHAPGRIDVLQAGDTTLAMTDLTQAPGFRMYGLTGGAPQASIFDSSWAAVRGIAADAEGNVYVSGIAKAFIRDDPQDTRRRTYKYVSRVYRYRADQNYARDDGNFFVDDGQGQGTIFEPGDIFVLGAATPHLYVADMGKDLAQRLLIQDNVQNEESEPLPSLALDGSETGAPFQAPVDFVADAAGFMYVVDRGNRRVVRYDAAGEFVQRVNVELDLDRDSLHVPVAAAADDSLVYVADRATGKLHAYKKRK